MSQQIPIFVVLRHQPSIIKLILLELSLESKLETFQQDSSYLNLSFDLFCIYTYILYVKYIIYPSSLIFKGKYYYQNLFQNSNK